MATDLSAIVARLRGFRDPAGLDVLAVGCGGGQLAGYLQEARTVTALDIDGEALERFHAAFRQVSGRTPDRCIVGGLEAWDGAADLVFLEFCLHEMPDPADAVQTAVQRAAEVLVADHYRGSPWALCTGEADKVERLWRALEGLHPAAFQSVEALQRFDDYEQLRGRVGGQGREAIEHIQRYRGERDLRIPMWWAMARFPGNGPGNAERSEV